MFIFRDIVILINVVKIESILIRVFIGFLILFFNNGCKVLEINLGLFLWN